MDLTTDNNDNNNNKDVVVQDALRRLCHGLPVSELTLTVEEATACEAQLLKEISLLERALNEDAAENQPEDNNDSKAEEYPLATTTAAVDAILDSPLTPLHQYWTASALLGRLRQDLVLPSLDPLQQVLRPAAAAAAASNANSQIHAEELALQGLSKQAKLAHAYDKQTLSGPTLLVVWKKISSNRAAGVFRRAVKPEEAPGYAERIAFPMDLGLVRKRVVAGNIQTLADLHGAVALISHNCVKYNGRESDYGRVAIEFETMADQVILQAVQQQLLDAGAAKELTVDSSSDAPVAATAAGKAPTAATAPVPVGAVAGNSKDRKSPKNTTKG